MTGPQSTATEPLSVRAAMVSYFLRRMGPALIAVVVYVVLATVVVRWDMARHDEPLKDFMDSLYGMFTQLFFEPNAPFPSAPIARALFWLSPLVGVVLLAEGLLKLGAELFDSEARHEVWVQVMSEKMSGHVVVCGLGHVGYRVVEELIKLRIPCVAIEQREAGAFVAVVRALGVPVHVEDARRDEVLAAAGVARARAVVCATNDDLANLEVAIDAKRMNPKVRVVMRMFDQRLASKVGGALEVDRTFSTSALSAPLIALQATQPGVRAAYRLDDGTTRVTAELSAGAELAPTTVEALEASVEARVVGLRRSGGGRYGPARSASTIGPGDDVIVDTELTRLEAVRAALRGSFRDPPMDDGPA